VTVSLRKRPKAPRTKPVEQRESQRHRKFVRTGKFAVCIVPGCEVRPLEFCHVRAGLPEGEQAGISTKPHDAFAVGMCSAHHREQHAIGEKSFEKKYGVKLLETALALSRISPDQDIQRKAREIRL
jgi:hypothetical protein